MMSERQQYRIRCLLSLATGILVAGMALATEWGTTVNDEGLKYRQIKTMSRIKYLSQALSEYLENNNSLPGTLEDMKLDPSYEMGIWNTNTPYDGWSRPFEYSTDGTTFLITSYGQDGKPGGIGDACDLTSDDPQPKNAAIPFSVFLKNHLNEKGGIFLYTLCGLIAGLVCWALIKTDQIQLKSINILVLRILQTLIGAFIILMILSLFHIPSDSGH